MENILLQIPIDSTGIKTVVIDAINDALKTSVNNDYWWVHLIVYGIIVGLSCYYGTKLKEMAKNSATKKDIAEITKITEDVKNEVSLEKQRESRIIEERGKCLFDILECVEQIYSYKLLLCNCSYKSDDISSLNDMIANINTLRIRATIKSDYIQVTYVELEDLKIIDSLVENMNLFGTDLISFVTNKIGQLKANESDDNIKVFKSEYEIDFGKCRTQYKELLNKLYRTGLFTKKIL